MNNAVEVKSKDKKDLSKQIERHAKIKENNSEVIIKNANYLLKNLINLIIKIISNTDYYAIDRDNT